MKRVSAYLLFILSLISCTPEALSPSRLVNEWVAISEEATAIDQEGNTVRLRLNFQDNGNMRGIFACNFISTDYEADEAGNFSLGRSITTQVGCSLNDWESTLSHDLRRTNRYSFEGKELILSHDSLGITLRFERDR